MATDVGRAPSGQALVASDGAATHLHPPGFDPSRYPRQWQPDLATALSEAVRMMRTEARVLKDSRSSRSQRMDKKVRRGIAASYDDWARIIEAHAIAMEAASAGETEGLDGNRDSAGLKGIAQTQSDEGMQ